MNNSKRNKIQAKLDCPATPEPEREVCRKILKDNPKEEPEYNSLDGILHTIQTPRNQTSGDFWEQARRNQQQTEAYARQRAAAQAQAAQAQQGFYGGMMSSLFGGVFSVNPLKGFGGLGDIFGAHRGKHCEQCGNNFFIKTEKDLYCQICLAAKRKEAEE